MNRNAISEAIAREAAEAPAEVIMDRVMSSTDLNLAGGPLRCELRRAAHIRAFGRDFVETLERFQADVYGQRA